MAVLGAVGDVEKFDPKDHTHEGVAGDGGQLLGADVLSDASAAGGVDKVLMTDAGGDLQLGAGDVVTSGDVDGRDVSADGTKLDGVEAGATADQTGAEIKAAYEAEADTNAFTDAEKTKLTGVETAADVTDAANVTSAGAVMKTTVDAKGDLLAGTADDTIARLAVGADGKVLTVDSGEATGIKWESAGGAPTGAIMAFGGAAAPAGWLDCSGAAVSRTTYAALFAVLGTTYGVGDGSTTFNLPDFRSRAVLGEGTGAGLSARARGNTGGAETHTLVTGEIPAHTHTVNRNQTAAGGTARYAVQGGGGTMNSGSTGGDGAHENMPPFGVAMFIVKT